MRRRKRKNAYWGLIGAMIFSAVLMACGAQGEDTMIPDVDLDAENITFDTDPEDQIRESEPADNDSMEKEAEENTQSDTDAKDEINISNTDSEDESQEPVPNEDGSMEIYSAREIISLSDDMIVGQVTLDDILEGNPILYDRVIIDGFVVEWILTDYEDEESILIEEGVLIISEENNAENTQVIRAQGRGGC